MICARCGSPVLVAQNFCGECGATLCSAFALDQRSPQSYTPRHIAEKILTSRATLSGERKQVTILFADIKGSLELLANTDPEDARNVLDPLLEHMMEGVHHYEGTVNQVLGDGIMAIFGAPLAHEDHALRACYAALRIQRNVARYSEETRRTKGIPVQMRIGVNSGEVVVRSIASDLHMDYTAVGQATHLAARMEQLATPGSILISADTHRLIEGLVEVRSLGPTPIKGITEPIEVLELLDAGPVRSRLQAAVARGLTPFMGRGAEMDVLRAALARAQSGQHQIVAISGEPGVGKSRLIHEFSHLSLTSTWLTLQSGSASYGRATPYLPVIELLRRYFVVNARDSMRTIREKVTGKVLTLSPSMQGAIPPLLDLLEALPQEDAYHTLDPLQHREHSYRAVIRLLLTECRTQPLLVVFEDLHWNDSLTLGMLTALIDAATDVPLMLLVSYRPEYKDIWSDRPNWTHLRLAPLGGGTLTDMLHALIGSDPSLDALKTVLLERAEGNPFFVEEIVRSLGGSGVISGPRGDCRLKRPLSSLQIPPTIHAVLSARIDRLSPSEKQVLQEASVIGHEVPHALLAAVSGLEEDELRACLDGLQAAEFIYIVQLYPELLYEFKHALTYEVAYAGQLIDKRRDTHARIAAAIESLYAGRLGEQVERLAVHALRGQLGVKALGYLRQAGVKAAERQAYPEALVLFEQAVGVLAQLEDGRSKLEQEIDLRFEMRNVLQPLGNRERIDTCLREAERYSEELDDPRRIGWIQSYLTEHFWMQGRYEEAVSAGTRALAIARELDDVPLCVVTNLPLGLAFHTRGEYRRAIECFDWNVTRLSGERLNERFGLFVLPSAFSRSFTAWAYADLGEFAAGTSIGEESIGIAEAAQHPFSCGYAYLGMGVLYLRQGDLRRAVLSLERALAARAFAESPLGFAYVSLHLGYALSLQGRVDEGLALLERSVALANSRHFVARHSLRLSYLAEARLIAGDAVAATETAGQALELARRHDERANEAYALRVIGEIALRGGESEKASDCFRAASGRATELGLRPLQAHCQIGISGALHALGQIEAARELNASAVSLAEMMNMRFWRAPLVTGGPGA